MTMMMTAWMMSKSEQEDITLMIQCSSPKKINPMRKAAKKQRWEVLSKINPVSNISTRCVRKGIKVLSVAGKGTTTSTEISMEDVMVVMGVMDVMDVMETEEVTTRTRGTTKRGLMLGVVDSTEIGALTETSIKRVARIMIIVEEEATIIMKKGVSKEGSIASSDLLRIPSILTPTTACTTAMTRNSSSK